MLPSAKSLGLFKRILNDKENDHQQNIPISSNQELNGGEKSNLKRVKTFPSVRNQFVIHIYYRLEDNEIIQDINHDFRQQSNDNLKVNFDLDPHISFVYGHYAVQYHQIEPLMNQLSELIKSFKTFSLCLNHVRILPNSDGTRFFIAVCEAAPTQSEDEHSITKTVIQKLKPSNHTNRVLIKSIHHILKQYRSEIVSVDGEKIDQFLFHTSVAWFLPENQSHAQIICDKLNREYFDDRVIFVRINQINIKVGHISRIINLL